MDQRRVGALQRQIVDSGQSTWVLFWAIGLLTGPFVRAIIDGADDPIVANAAGAIGAIVTPGHFSQPLRDRQVARASRTLILFFGHSLCRVHCSSLGSGNCATREVITMTAIEHATPDPVSFAGAILDRYRHVCAFVDSREEMHRIFDPFVTEGLEHGEKALHFVDPAQRADYVRHFEQLGIDMPTLVEQGRFELLTWNEAYLRGGHFDLNAMLSLVDELLGGSQSPRIRLVGDMGWATADLPGVGGLIEYEARLNYALPNYEHVVICVYNTAEVGSDVVIDVLRTHPMALVGGLIQVNPFFVPPAEFLDELRQRGRLAPDA
jgi:hypothetical protein